MHKTRLKVICNWTLEWERSVLELDPQYCIGANKCFLACISKNHLVVSAYNERYLFQMLGVKYIYINTLYNVTVVCIKATGLGFLLSLGPWADVERTTR